MFQPRPAPDSTGILVQCRPGFEPDAAQELAAAAEAAKLDGEIEVETGCGFVVLALAAPLAEDALQRRLDASRLVFARQSFRELARIDALPERDRLAPIRDAVAATGLAFSRVLAETPDTNDGKTSSAFLRRFQPILEAALTEAGRLKPGSVHLPRLHLFFPTAGSVRIGTSRGTESSDWPMGIPRLKMPREAPSRSTLKLAEAFATLLTPDEARTTLRAGLSAVDLGASPGGWSWQFASRGMRVTAIDNGPIAPQLMNTGLVEHLRADGFAWRPKKPVEWLVCDMVEAPARVAPLIADWFAAGRCRRAIFNLKLPMKKRHAEIERCRGLIDARLKGAGIAYQLRIRHLYHDREEVTAYLARR